jgi:hypothetical protein
MKPIVKYILILVFLPGMISCKKFVDNGAPLTSLSADKVFSDSTATVSAVLALYGKYANNDGFVLNSNQYGAMSSDDAYYLNSSSYDQFRTNMVTPTNSGVIDMPCYQGIYGTNIDLQGIPTNNNISQGLKNQLMGECEFWRAYFYFYVINFYGDMPLITGNNTTENAQSDRTPVAQIYQQIISDLTDAKKLLTNTYPSANRARINKKAVSAFLARVYLYQKNYSAAESEATEVIVSGIYSLDADLNTVFLKTSNETIWQIESNYSATVNGVTTMGNAWLPASTTPIFVLYNSLVNEFETGDNRSASWTQSIVYNNTTYYYPYKYKYRSTSVSGNEYSVMLRLSEQYLVRSEARLMQSNLSGAQADLNVVRARAGLPNTKANDNASMLLALEHERWVELFTENSDRWFNLKRTGRANTVLSATKNENFQDYMALYPIPQNDLNTDPNLTQNPGY